VLNNGLNNGVYCLDLIDGGVEHRAVYSLECLKEGRFERLVYH